MKSNQLAFPLVSLKELHAVSFQLFVQKFNKFKCFQALDALLDISGMSSLQNMERCFPNAQINGMSSPNIFLGNGLSEEVSTAGIEKSSYQVFT